MEFWFSLSTILKFSSIVVWPVVLQWSYIGKRALRCSLNLSQNVLEDSPMYSSSHLSLLHLYLYMMPLFLFLWSLFLSATRRSLMVLPPLNYTWCHVSNIHFLYFHWGLLCIVPLYSFFWCWSWYYCWLAYFCCYYLLNVQEHWSYFSSCLQPILDTCILSGLFVGVLVLYVNDVGWCIEL